MKPLSTAIFVAAALAGGLLNANAQGKPKTGCGSDVSLVVTISGSRSAPGGYGLTSDGSGPYRDGTKGAAKVSAIFQVDNCTHDFTTNVASSTRAMWALLSDGDQRAWFFNLDRVHSVPVTPEGQSAAEAFAATHAFCTGGVQTDFNGMILKGAGTAAWYHDNYAGCGVDELGRAFVRRAGGFSLDPDDRLSFQISPIDRPLASCSVDPSDPACGASFLRVYHPDIDTWIVRSEPDARGSHRVWAGGNAGYVFVGYEVAPFEITAVKK